MFFCEPLPQAGSIFDLIIHELVGHDLSCVSDSFVVGESLRRCVSLCSWCSGVLGVCVRPPFFFDFCLSLFEFTRNSVAGA